MKKILENMYPEEERISNQLDRLKEKRKISRNLSIKSRFEESFEGQRLQRERRERFDEEFTKFEGDEQVKNLMT
jgi:hypothetical protein